MTDDRDHWQAAARAALAGLDVAAMTALHYRQLTAELQSYPRKSGTPTLRLVQGDVPSRSGTTW